MLTSPAKELQGTAAGDGAPATQRDKTVADNKMVRTDARARTMDAFVSRRSFGDRDADPARAAAAAVAASGTPLASMHSLRFTRSMCSLPSEATQLAVASETVVQT